jgi:hypothetical protein
MPRSPIDVNFSENMEKGEESKRHIIARNFWLLSTCMSINEMLQTAVEAKFTTLPRHNDPKILK